MRRAVVHIGTEKTGTTSLQSFLLDNLDVLRQHGVLYPSSCGFSSNMRLVVFAKKNPEPDLLPVDFDIKNLEACKAWREDFRLTHNDQIERFFSSAKTQMQGDNEAQPPTVIYSSEHLQSRLCAIDEIKTVKEILSKLYDSITILIYLRRQDRYALSAHSSSLRGGATEPFSFGGLHKGGPYYNYKRTLDQWSSIFGVENIIVRLFEPERLHKGDVLADFTRVAGIDSALAAKGTDATSLQQPQVENSALSYTGRQQMLLFNRYVKSGQLPDGIDPQALRQFFLRRVEEVQDELGTIKPARQEAEEFYEHFRADNQTIADRWLDGQNFGEDFSDYPQLCPQPTIEDQSGAVKRVIDEFIESNGQPDLRQAS